MASELFDLIVIGAGPGGYVAAIRAAQLGLKVACIEKDKALGGTCLNVGCIPSKALLDSSEHYEFAKHKLAKHGVAVGDVKLDLGQMMKRKEAIVRQLTNGIAGLFKKNKIEWVLGTGSLGSAASERKTVHVKSSSGDRVLETKYVLIATGSEPSALPFLPFDGKNVISSTEALALSEVPKHLVVIGGGAIGLELGSVWQRLGSRVTVIEYLDSIVPAMDREMTGHLQKILAKQGMEFRLSTKCLGATQNGNWMVVEVEDRASSVRSKIECDKILVATGRRAFTASLGLEKAGIALDKQGRVEINASYVTKLPGVYAIGDVVRGPMLAHKAEEEGVAVAEIIAGQKGHVNIDAIPSVVYTWPELASVGLTDAEAKAKGHETRTGSFPFLANGRAKALDDTDGLVKVVADARTDRVLGVQILGPRASDMIAEAVAFLEFHASSEDIARTCHAHPTLSEAFKEAALAVDKRAIHI